MEQLRNDFRVAVRGLRASAAFTVAAVITLALGIGANTAIFSVANNVLLRPLPYRDPGRLAIIWNDYGSGGQSLPAVSLPDFRDYQLRAQQFEGFAASTYASAELTGKNGSQQVDVGLITSNFFSLLGVKPILGRSFTSDETIPNGPHVAMLTHRIWQQQFGERPDIIGQTISVGRVPTTVVGVLPPGFELELPPEKFLMEDSDIYQPLQFKVETIPRNLTRDDGTGTSEARCHVGSGTDRDGQHCRPTP